LIVADRQTHGRGRGQHRWWTGPGSLACTLLLDPAHLRLAGRQAPVDLRAQSHLLGLATTLAMIEAISALYKPRLQTAASRPILESPGPHGGEVPMIGPSIVPGGRSALPAIMGEKSPADLPPQTAESANSVHSTQSIGPETPRFMLGLHWPNDLIIDGRKVAGVLVEFVAQDWCAIGIGINTNNTSADAPPEVKNIAVSLRELTGQRCDHSLLLVGLLRRLERAFSLLELSPEQIPRAADRLCLQRNRSLRLQLGTQNVEGICRGIAEDGALLLESAGKVEKFFSGHVVATHPPLPFPGSAEEG